MNSLVNKIYIFVNVQGFSDLVSETVAANVHSYSITRIASFSLAAYHIKHIFFPSSRQLPSDKETQINFVLHSLESLKKRKFVFCPATTKQLRHK